MCVCFKTPCKKFSLWDNKVYLILSYYITVCAVMLSPECAASMTETYTRRVHVHVNGGTWSQLRYRRDILSCTTKSRRCLIHSLCELLRLVVTTVSSSLVWGTWDEDGNLAHSPISCFHAVCLSDYRSVGLSASLFLPLFPWFFCWCEVFSFDFHQILLCIKFSLPVD